MTLLDGKKVAQSVKEQLSEEVTQWRKSSGIQPCLAVILVGEDPASQVYVRNKIKSCEAVGIKSLEVVLPADVSADKLKAEVTRLNEDASVHGLLVQLPLPDHLNESEVLSWIDPKKDPDGLTVENIGLLFSGQPRTIPCTPYGVMKILEHYEIDPMGKKAVVMGRSNIVGKPMALLLQNAGATVTICHSKTPNTPELAKQADILVVAIGKPELVGREYVKEGAVVVDVGIHRKENDEGKPKLCGDVKFQELVGWAGALTPVPGGVGPMTIAMLLANTLNLAKLQNLS